MKERPYVYIATLGNAPQVVTLALDQLLPRHPFVEVCIIHTDDTTGGSLPVMKFGNMHETVRQLDKEFRNPVPQEAPPGERAWLVDYRLENRFYRFI